MKQFTYFIHADYAMHFGPAGQLAQLIREYGDKVVVKVEGPSEVELSDVLYQYFEDRMSVEIALSLFRYEIRDTITSEEKRKKGSASHPNSKAHQPSGWCVSLFRCQ